MAQSRIITQSPRAPREHRSRRKGRLGRSKAGGRKSKGGPNDRGSGPLRAGARAGLALIQSTLPILGARWRDPALMNVARSTALAQLLFVAFSFAALVTLHVTSDFSVANVFENSHSLKPLIYKVTGVWGNHEGSMLLWVSILALFGGLVAAFGNNLPLSLRAHVLGVQAWIASAFYLFILITSNPFLRIANPPIEGRDLNPVLQDIGLAVHPPMLYLGYVGFSISFSFAVAAL